MKNADMPAMPQSGMETICGDLNDSKDWGGSGLTKREHFAAMAMQGILSNDGMMQTMARQYTNEGISPNDRCASLSVNMADSLLAELEKNNGE